MSSLPSPDKIVFDAVTCSFELAGQPFLAVDQVSLGIADGEFVTLVGPSGCGKSTLMNLAAGLLEPTAGEVVVDGSPVTGLGGGALRAARRRMGMLFQFGALFTDLSVFDNVAFALLIQVPTI